MNIKNKKYLPCFVSNSRVISNVNYLQQYQASNGYVTTTMASAAAGTTRNRRTNSAPTSAQLKNVFFASLKNESEKNAFCKIVDNYLSILIKLSQSVSPDYDHEIIEERINYQKNYCIQQMKNEKTSLVLLKYFDKKWVDEYIKKVLFDF